jgi:hypothetical protein
MKRKNAFTHREEQQKGVKFAQITYIRHFSDILGNPYLLTHQVFSPVLGVGLYRV